MLKKEEKKRNCTICENGNKVIRSFSVRDVEKLLDEMMNFQNHEGNFRCEVEDIEMGILADGTIVIEAEFKGILSQVIR